MYLKSEDKKFTSNMLRANFGRDYFRSTTPGDSDIEVNRLRPHSTNDCRGLNHPNLLKWKCDYEKNNYFVAVEFLNTRPYDTHSWKLSLKFSDSHHFNPMLYKTYIAYIRVELQTPELCDSEVAATNMALTVSPGDVGYELGGTRGFLNPREFPPADNVVEIETQIPPDRVG
ncbi:hypothetical protein BDQ17DRAFT_1331092 [Cyathus striatus]|nr:hypothetical protein BDQ17DRAFT_1331092 [Cyathus striatus]